MGYENGDNTGYILNGGGGGSDIDYGAAEGGDNFAIDYADFYSGISPDVPEEIPYAPYEPVSLEPPTFEPFPQPPSNFSEDLYFENLDYYLGQRYDDFTADQLAQQAAAAGISPPIQIGSEPILPTTEPILPEIRTPEYIVWSYQPWETPPYIPTFPEPPAPPPPTQPLPPSPATQQPNLPPYCPRGQYHPYPIGHPQQNICVPFPTTPQQQQQRQPGQQPTPSPSPAPAPRPPGGQQQQRPPQQQPCPTGYKRDPGTLRCVPITPQQQQQQPTTRCMTPGTVFDQTTGRCVPKGQAISPLPIPDEAEDMLSDLKQLPWWVWLALAGLLLLGSQGEERKRVTVQHRRAS